MKAPLPGAEFVAADRSVWFRVRAGTGSLRLVCGNAYERTFVEGHLYQESLENWAKFLVSQADLEPVTAEEVRRFLGNSG